MTLIGIATYGDHAEFITDSASYTKRVEMLGVTTKHLTLNHLDAALMTSGNSDFGYYAKVSALKLGGVASTFDELAERLPDTLRAVRSDMGEVVNDAPTTVCLVGYSPAAGGFVIRIHAEEQDYKPLQVKTFLTPTPWNLRPSGIEMRRVGHNMQMPGQHESRTSLWPQVQERWRTSPPMTAPTSTEEWAELAQTVHVHRSIDNFDNVLVLGNIVHTRLERGAVTTRTIHTIEDTEEDFRRIMSGTRHPIGQMKACWCESGQAYRDCHLKPEWTDPCGCASGKTFYECCMVPERAQVGSSA